MRATLHSERTRFVTCLAEDEGNRKNRSITCWAEREMIKEAFKWLVSTPQELRPWWKVIVWWELRRIPVNILVGCVGFISLLGFFLFITLAHELKPGEDAVEPLVLLATPILFNIGYTAGWIAELFLRIVWKERNPVIASALLKLGLSGSLFCALMPSVVWFVIWITRSI